MLTVTITRTNHALYGQKVLVVRIFRAPKKILLVRLPDGANMEIPQAWTDYECPNAPVPEAQRHLLDINGLRDLVKIIAHERDKTT